MRIFQYLQSIYDKHDVKVAEKNIEPKPILCDFCEKESVKVIIHIENPTSTTLDWKDCKQVMVFYCAEHAPKESEI